ncbi:MAG: sulfide/dihydroorotate dehydrogenase-like FAD/NAD-binding protein [Deltaproteobacteria bacterium]|jgi:ferredoxin--NADP+ reductase|nr:sulfide/dihydroorotate dehydrogenase-like FAD/NAD-binding protein [Deltaproteobacteria bacterium]
MFKIVKKKALNQRVTSFEIEAPDIAAKVQAGQFLILRVDGAGERIPLTICGADAEKGTVTIIFQIVGATTEMLNLLGEGEDVHDLVGPLGNPTKLSGQKVCLVGGGVGTAIVLPVAKSFGAAGFTVHSIIGYQNKDLVILEDEFRACSDKLVVMTDDGSYGQKGLVTAALKDLIESGEKYDEVMAVGPLVMMKAVCQVTKPHGIKTTVSMNSLMLDGTGMCGCCRVTVGGQTKFTCVDGPDFDGFEVDFEEAALRSRQYRDFEIASHQKVLEAIKAKA